MPITVLGEVLQLRKVGTILWEDQYVMWFYTKSAHFLMLQNPTKPGAKVEKARVQV